MGLPSIFCFPITSKHCAKHVVFKHLSDLGLLPALILAIIVAPLVGELPWPDIKWGSRSRSSMTCSPSGRPFPSGSDFRHWLYLSAAPLVAATYIVLFGELIQAEALIDEARDFRHGDEDVHFDANRNNMIVGIRNIGMSMLGPDCSMCGPMWAAMQVVDMRALQARTARRWTAWSAAWPLSDGDLLRLFHAPIVTLVKPILPIALSLTMLVQGFVAVRVGILKARTFNDLGVAGSSAPC